MVSIGTRIVRVTKDGFVPSQQTVTIKDASEGVSVEFELVREVGRLIIVVRPADSIRLDGDKFVSMGRLEARITAGPHRLVVSAPGMRKQESEVTVVENRTRTINVTLEKEKGGALPLWAWIGGGVLVAAGIAVGAYFVVSAATATQFQPIPGALGGVTFNGFRFP